MQFVKMEDLKPGMRIARPIYSKKGVLLFERDSKLNASGIDSIRNFGLLGLFVLEPAEPAPPMTPEDIEFERFQTINSFAIKDELDSMLNTHKFIKLPTIVSDIIRSYGYLDKKINFAQSLRTKEDYIYRHCLNVAMLVALMGHKYGLRNDELNDAVTSAVVHDIGKLMAPAELQDKDDRDDNDEEAMERYQTEGFDILDDMFQTSPNVKRIAAQTLNILQRYRYGGDKANMKLVEGTKVMTVAEFFDAHTAMRFGGKPESELDVIRKMQEAPDTFDKRAVKALVDSINILSEGISVVLSTGDTALILQENPKNILRPVVLCFRDNAIMNLADTYMYGDIEVADVMKTLDNRYVMDKRTLDEHSDDAAGGADGGAADGASGDAAGAGDGVNGEA
ncbi:MAG: HD domain-containing protein [Lachnospiraceae bacterium]|nr:HD domain-containing protein [Lachnospiraceae bacterium]